jgi:hypothetical protein
MDEVSILRAETRQLMAVIRAAQVESRSSAARGVKMVADSKAAIARAEACIKASRQMTGNSETQWASD